MHKNEQSHLRHSRLSKESRNQTKKSSARLKKISESGTAGLFKLADMSSHVVTMSLASCESDDGDVSRAKVANSSYSVAGNILLPQQCSEDDDDVY